MIVKPKFASTRDNTRSSLIETSDNVNGDITVHVTDWWSGDGIDISISSTSSIGKNREVDLELSAQELQNLFTLAIVHGMLDVELALTNSKKILEEAEKRKISIRRITEGVKI